MTTSKPAVSDTGPEIDLSKVVQVLWAQKWLVAACGLIFGALGVTYALLAIPVFRAEVTITPAHDGTMGAAASLASQFGGIASLAGIDLQGSDNSRESRAVLKSRSLVEDFIVRHKMVAVLLKDAEKQSTWRAVEYFRKNVLTVRDDNRAGTTVVSIDWKDPKVAATWANDFVALANEIVRARALAEANRNIAYLNEQLKHESSLEVQKVMFRLIETETKNSMLASGRTEYAFTVIDAAVTPEIRVSPKRTLIALGSTLLGGVFGSGIALWRVRRRSPS